MKALKNKGLLPRIITISVVTIAVIIVAIVLISKDSKSSKFNKLMQTANEYLTNLDYESAIASYKEAIEINPQNVEAYLGLADAYVGLGDYDSAIDVLKKGLALFPDNAELTSKVSEIQDLIDVKISKEQKATEHSIEEETASEVESNIKLDASLPYASIDFSPEDFKVLGTSFVDEEWSLENITELAKISGVWQDTTPSDLDTPFYTFGDNEIRLYTRYHTDTQGDLVSLDTVCLNNNELKIYNYSYSLNINLQDDDYYGIEMPVSILDTTFDDIIERIGLSEEIKTHLLNDSSHNEISVNSQYGNLIINIDYYSCDTIITIYYPNAYISFDYTLDGSLYNISIAH